MGLVPPPAKKLPLRLTSAGAPWAGAQKYGLGSGGALSQLGLTVVAPWFTGLSTTALTAESKDNPSMPDALDGLNSACHADVTTSLPAGRFPDSFRRSLLIVKFALTILSTAVTSSSSGLASFGPFTHTRHASLLR